MKIFYRAGCVVNQHPLLLLALYLIIFLPAACEHAPEPAGNGVEEYPLEAACVSSDLTVVFTKPGSSTSDAGDSLVKLIEGQTDGTIYLCLYDFDYEPVIKALEGAIDRGVRIKFIGDKDREKKEEGYTRLRRAIEEKYDLADYYSLIYSGLEIMHNKFILAVNTDKDEKYVWTGSANVTKNGFCYNNNNCVTVQSQELYDIYLQQFDYLFDGSGSPVCGKRSVTVDCGTIIDVIFSYKGSGRSSAELPAAALVSEVSSACETLDFMVFTFENSGSAGYAIQEAILKLNNNGIAVQGVLDCFQSVNDDTLFSLGAEGISVCEDGNEHTNPEDSGGGILHHKVGIVDRGLASACVITGSMNWTVAGNAYNAENILFIHSYDIAQRYYEEFTAIYDEGE